MPLRKYKSRMARFLLTGTACFGVFTSQEGFAQQQQCAPQRPHCTTISPETARRYYERYDPRHVAPTPSQQPDLGTQQPAPWMPSPAPETTPAPMPMDSTPSVPPPPVTPSPSDSPMPMPEAAPGAPPVPAADMAPTPAQAPDVTGGGFDQPLSSSLAASSVDAPMIPNMIGDQFSVGMGQMVVPLIVGQAILHADSVGGIPTNSGINDFHVIDQSLSPVGFAGGSGGSGFFFFNPDFVFAQMPNGDPIQPASVGGLQTGDPTLFGAPAGSDPTYTATQTGEVVTVQDQTSSDVFPNAPIYLITQDGVFVGNGSSSQIIIPTVSPSTGGVVVGRQKIAENTSPIPRDRVFLNYSYFNNVPLFPDGVDVNRFSPGFEKTFFDGLTSVEVRVPFASTLDSDILADGITDTSNLEFGNVNVALKALLYSNQNVALAAGLALSLPSADDTRVSMQNGTELVRLENESVHVLPFVGGVYMPNDRLFAQGFVQFDFDANGNPVHLNATGTGLREVGTANDAAFAFVDVGLGYWVYRNTSGNSRITGIAPTVELHYNRSLQDSDVIQQGLFRIGSFQDDVQILDALIGATVQMGNNTTLTTAYVAPIGNSSDQVFDGELRVAFNWFFGQSAQGTNPLSFLTR